MCHAVFNATRECITNDRQRKACLTTRLVHNTIGRKDPKVPGPFSSHWPIQ